MDSAEATSPLLVAAVGMVRDEEDIVEGTLRHLLDQGVGLIIVADNLSTDSTPAILARLTREDPRIVVVQDNDPAYRQSEKMTALARRAMEAGAAWIVPFDADERFYSYGEETVAAFLGRTTDDIVSVDVFEYVPTPLDNPQEPDPVQRMLHREPKAGGRKVVFRACPAAVVAMGNHDVTGHSGKRGRGLFLRHYSFRSERQFIRKVRTGASAVRLAGEAAACVDHWAALDCLSDEALSRSWRERPTAEGMVLDPDAALIRASGGGLKHLALCIPCYRDIHAEVFLGVINALSLSRPEGWGPVLIYTEKLQPVSWCRQVITERALGGEGHTPGDPIPDILLWMDSDVGVDDPQDLWRLVQHLDAAPPEVWVLGAPIVIRTPPAKDPASGLFVESPPLPNISTYPEATTTRGYRLVRDGCILPTNPEDATPERPFAAVQAVGMGLTAVRAEAFRRVKHPWWEFKVVPDEKTGQPKRYGEDFGFCDQVRLAGGFVVGDWSIRGWHYIEQKRYTPLEWIFRDAPVTW